jgi:hypothetical protein
MLERRSRTSVSVWTFFAPGVSITSAWKTNDTATNTISGTSMAAPHVAGVAAQYLEDHSLATPAQVAKAITCFATPNHITSAGSGSPNLLLYNGFLPQSVTGPCPPSLSLTTTVGSVRLTWTVPPDGGSPITGYKIFRGTSSGGEDVDPVATPAANETSYDDTSVTGGTKYFYQVAAVNVNGETRSDERSVLFTSPITAFALNSNRSVSWRRFTGTWSSWQNLGGYSSSDPVSTSDGPTLFVFVRGSNGALYFGTITGSNTWSGWQGLGGYFVGNPAVTTDDNGMSVVVRGSNNALYTRRWNGSAWGGWQSLGGYLVSDPAATSDGPVTTVVARGGGNALYFRDLSGGTWGPWTGLGGQLAGNPAIATDSGGTTIVARNANNAVYSRRRASGGGPWTGWQSLPGASTAADPAAAGDTVTRVFIRGAGNAIYMNEFDGSSWSGWSSLGGGLSSEPAAAFDTAGTTVVARAGSALWWRHLVNGGTWSPWASLGGSLTANPSATPG